jgi:hypothetical protein
VHLLQRALLWQGVWFACGSAVDRAAGNGGGVTDHGQLVPADEDLHGRADAPTDRISIAELSARPVEGIVLADGPGQGYPDGVLVSDAERDALLDAVDRARDLADLAAHVACEPRRFLNNEDSVQHLLGEAVARVRDTLAHFEFDHQSKEAAAPVREDSATTSSTREGV